MEPAGFGGIGPGERGLAVRGVGPLLASTCRELCTWTPWDVNGYYRAFGFRLGERPTKAQLRQAYLRLDGAHNLRLTAILHVLLRQRADYDRTPFGETYLDELTMRDLRRAAQMQAYRQGRERQEVLDEWGFIDLPEDFAELEREFLATTSSPRWQRSATVTWPWSWYADRTEAVDIARLAYWQQLLIPHLPVARFAVGLSGYGDPVSSRLIGGEWTVFLRDTEWPDEGWARLAGQQAQSSVLNALPNNGTRRTMKYVGGSAARKTVDEETSFASSGRKYAYLSSVLKKDGDSVIIRFMDNVEMPPEERNFWITLAVHNYVPVKNSAQDSGNDKKRTTMMAICRTQRLLAGEHDDCYICEHMTKPDKKGKERPWSKSATTFARAVHREKVKITQADVDADEAPPEALGRWAMKDKLVEVEEMDKDGKPTGRKVMSPEVFLIQQKESNFFQPIAIMAEEYEGTVLDRDFKITRTGEGLDTVYTPAPLNQTPNFNLADAETRKPYDDVFSWEEFIEFIDNLHSDEYYGKFFDPSWVDPDAEEKKPSRPVKANSASNVVYTDDDDEAADKPAPSGSGVSKEKMRAMKARMQGVGTLADTEDSSSDTDEAPATV